MGLRSLAATLAATATLYTAPLSAQQIAIEFPNTLRTESQMSCLKHAQNGTHICLEVVHTDILPKDRREPLEAGVMTMSFCPRDEYDALPDSLHSGYTLRMHPTHWRMKQPFFGGDEKKEARHVIEAVAPLSVGEWYPGNRDKLMSRLGVDEPVLSFEKNPYITCTKTRTRYAVDLGGNY